VLKSRWVSPHVLLSSGYDFVHTDLESALRTVAR
jgi:NAD dependent epimerase/dehydratase family enzyme